MQANFFLLVSSRLCDLFPYLDAEGVTILLASLAHPHPRRKGPLTGLLFGQFGQRHGKDSPVAYGHIGF